MADTMFNDERDDLLELKKDLAKVFDEERNALIFNPMSMAERAKSTVTGFFNFSTSDDLVSVKVNPFARKATIIVRPTDTSAFEMSVELKEMVKMGMKFSIKF